MSALPVIYLVLGLLCSLTCATCGARTKVITSLEDTLISRGRIGRKNTRSIDRRWTHNLPTGSVFYPGIVQFHIELARGESQNSHNTNATMVMQVGSTHRANLKRSISPSGEFGSVFKKAGARLQRLLVSVVADKGMVDTDRGYVFATEKIKMQRNYQRKNKGSFQYVFVGNNAQGDVLAATTMLQDPKSCVKAAFIHDVVGSKSREAHTPLSVKYSGYGTYGLYYYKTAADAAVLAVKQKLLSVDGLERVLHTIKNSTQYQQCKTPCSCESCGRDNLERLLQRRKDMYTEIPDLLKYQQCWCEDCQAAAPHSVPPACPDLLRELESAELFLQKIRSGCTVHTSSGNKKSGSDSSSSSSTSNKCPHNMWCRLLCDNNNSSAAAGSGGGSGGEGTCVAYQRLGSPCSGSGGGGNREGKGGCKDEHCAPYSNINCLLNKGKQGSTAAPFTGSASQLQYGVCTDVVSPDIPQQPLVLKEVGARLRQQRHGHGTTTAPAIRLLKSVGSKVGTFMQKMVVQQSSDDDDNDNGSDDNSDDGGNDDSGPNNNSDDDGDDDSNLNLSDDDGSDDVGDDDESDSDNDSTNDEDLDDDQFTNFSTTGFQDNDGESDDNECNDDDNATADPACDDDENDDGDSDDGDDSNDNDDGDDGSGISANLDGDGSTDALLPILLGGLGLLLCLGLIGAAAAALSRGGGSRGRGVDAGAPSYGYDPSYYGSGFSSFGDYAY